MRMKISFVEPHLRLFGGIRRVIELANRLMARGHDVTIYHSDGNPCEWMACEAKTRRSTAVLKGQHEVLIYNDPNPKDYLLVKLAKARLKVHYTLGLYNSHVLKSKGPRIFLLRNRKTLILKMMLRAPHLQVSNATWMREWLIENMKLRSALLFGGVNHEIFHPVQVVKNPAEMRLLCTGDPRTGKGTNAVLQAVHLARLEEPAIVLDRYYGKDVQQERMAAVYSAADIFVDGQTSGGWNNPVAEAMACKVPVVCTDIGGVRDFAFHEKTALLVPPDDHQAMAAAILRLSRSPSIRETLRENAFQHIHKFNWDKSAAELERLLVMALESCR